MKIAPRINGPYWFSLVVASIFGTNMGDFFSEDLGLGYFAGLPWIAATLAAIFLVERLTPWKAPVFFWLAIIVIRTGATNIGDIFHFYKVVFQISVPLMIVVYILFVGLYRRSWSLSSSSSVKLGLLYWITMVAAGVLGTVGGDGASFGIRLMPTGTAVVFGILILASLAFWGKRQQLTHPLPYWITLALIRTCGTGAGDALGHALGIGLSTIMMGFLFTATIFVFYVLDRDNQIQVDTNSIVMT